MIHTPTDNSNNQEQANACSLVLCSTFSMSHMAEYTNYASFNTFTVQGRILNSEIKSGKYGDFLSVSAISTLVRDGAEVTITFTDNAGLLALAQKGHLDAGRQVTLTGRIGGVSEVYEDKNGGLQMRKRPEITMTQVSILDGGLGAKPRSEARNTVTPGQVTRASERYAQADAQPEVDAAPSWC